MQVLQDFTDDRDRLLSIIETLIVGEDQDSDETTNDASTADTGAAFGQDDTEFNIFNTDRQLSALQTAAKMLGTLNEKKSLIYFASGLRLNGIDNQAQLHATINAAIRAGRFASGRSTRAAWWRRRRWATPRKGRPAASACTPAHRPWRCATTSSSRRTRCTRWPPIPAARRCSITTT